MRLPLPPRLPSTMKWDLCTVLILALLNVYLAQLADSLPSTMVEGDMAVPEDQGGQGGVQHSFVMAEDSLWADGLVPWKFEKLELAGGDLEDLFRDEDMQMIRSVLHGITEAVPCVRFREVAYSHTGHCLIITVMGDSVRSDKGCWSFVGKVGPQGNKTGQSLNLGWNCLHRGIVLHEVMHALGATHEQNREDRDLFVRINHENILENASENFQKKTEGFNTRGTPYDYQSIMHYKASDFSKNGEATITPLRRHITLRENSELSLIDIVELSKVYEPITSTSCFSKEMLLRYVTQLETMKSRLATIEERMERRVDEMEAKLRKELVSKEALGSAVKQSLQDVPYLTMCSAKEAYHSKGTIPYDSFLVNFNNADGPMNRRTGVFTSHAAGIYSISFSAYAVLDSDKFANIWLFLNGVMVDESKWFAANSNSNSNTTSKDLVIQGSRTLMLALDLGDTLELRTPWSNGKLYWIVLCINLLTPTA